MKHPKTTAPFRDPHGEPVPDTSRSAGARLVTYAIEPAGFLMTRRMLLGVKQRAESLRAACVGETRANQRPAA
jgi:hypothetical protein